jgi:hypothetical protein
MTKTQKYIVYGGALYLVGYLVWKKFYYKPPTVLVSGNSNNAPEEVKYATGKELGADGTTFYNTATGHIDTLFRPLKKPIYIKPKNSIPNVYDNTIGLDVNCSGSYMNATGAETIQKNCNKINLNLQPVGTQLPTDLPKLPY